MDYSVDERASAQAFEVWSRVAAEPFSWAAEAAEPPRLDLATPASGDPAARPRLVA